MKWLVVAVVTMTLQAMASAAMGASNTCSAYLYSRDEDMDVKVVSILGMHNSNGGKCDTTYNIGALQNAIALHFAADLINGYNGTTSFIPGIRIGIEIYDDCNTQYLAAYHAGALVSQIRCVSESSVSSSASAPDVPVVGVIGTSISDTTTIVAKVLEPAFIPVLGPSATIPELSNKTLYPHFVRVVPSDFKQIQVIVQLAKYFEWSYIVGLSTSDNYGRQGMAELMKLAKEQMICVLLIEDLDLFDEADMYKLARTTLLDTTMENIKDDIGIVYFGLNDPLLRFLKYIQKNRNSWSQEHFQRTQKIYWLASDAVQASQELATLVSQFKTNILVVSPYLVNITSFKKYFIEFLKAPPAWVNGQWKQAVSNVVQNALGCKTYNFTEESLNACNIDDKLVFDAYIPSVLDAFFILTNKIKQLHQGLCQNTSGPCLAFKTGLSNGWLKDHSLQNLLDYSAMKPDYLPPEFSSRKLKMISEDFEVLNQSLYSLQAIKSGVFVKVAEFKGDTILKTPELDDIFSSSECNTVCEDCQSIGEISYLFYPGNVLFIGIFSVQWQSNQNPYKCDMYRETSTSYIALEAFINIVHQLNNITNINFGYLIIDDCYNTLTLTKLLNGVMSGDIPIQSSSGRRFNASQVAVAIGAQSSDVTLAALPILMELNIPVISYSATHPVLDNRILYPYFSRTVSSDNVQSKAFVSILKYLEVTFVGAIVVENSYGLELYTLFRQLAEAEAICVDDAVRVTNQVYDYNFDSVLNKYRSKKIQVIIVIAMEITINSLLSTVKTTDTFVFLASETWGPNPDIIRGDGGKKARGCLVLGTSPVSLNYNIKKHLESLDPYGNTSTAWLRDFWQDHFQCDMPGGFSNTHGEICSRSIHNISTIVDDLADSPLAVNAAMATMSAGLTVSEFFKSNKQMPFNASEFTKALRLTKLKIPTGEIRVFNDAGNSDYGFDIYNVQSNTDSRDKYIYVKVGHFQDKTGLSLNKSLIKFYDASGRIIDKVESSCLYHQQCSMVCGGPKGSVSPGPATPPTIGKAEATDMSFSSTAVIILAVLLALFVLLAILLIVVGVLAFTGKIHIKGRSLVIDDMKSSGVIKRDRKNTYNTPSENSCSDIRPQLPTRKKTEKRVVYKNKSLSDILPCDHSNADEHITRDRSQSMPTHSHHTLSGQQSFPLSHVPENVKFLLLNQPNLFDKTQQRSIKRESPAGLSSPAGGEPSGYQTARQNNPYPMYVNTMKGVNYPYSLPQEDIIFQNVCNDSAVYKLTSPEEEKWNSVLHKFPSQTEYVQVQTQKGIVYIPSGAFYRLLQNSSSNTENQSEHGHATNRVSDQNTLHRNGNLGASNSHSEILSEVPASMPSTEYITPIDVIYGTQHNVLNSANAKSSPEIFAQNHINNDPVNVVVYHPVNLTDTSKLSPESHVCEMHTVDSSNYLLPRNLGQVIAAMGTDTPSLAQGNTNKMLPVFVYQQPDSVMKTAGRPDSLQLDPVYTQIKPEHVPQISQQLTDSSNVALVRHTSQGSLSPGHIQNKDANNKILDGKKVNVTQTEQQVRAPDHFRSSQILLSQVIEELEETV